MEEIKNKIIEKDRWGFNIMERATEGMSYRLAKELDEYCLKVLSMPKWILKRQWLLRSKLFMKIYDWFYRPTITQRRDWQLQGYIFQFFKGKKKVGEKIIRDIDLL